MRLPPCCPRATCPPQRRNRHLSPQTVHGDPACPRHPEKGFGQVCLCVPGLRSPSTAAPQAADPSPVPGQLLSHDSVFLAVHLSPGSLSHGRLVFCGRVVASVVRLGESGGQSRPDRARLVCCNVRVPLASWPPNQFQARRSGTTGRGQEAGRTGSEWQAWAYEIQHPWGTWVAQCVSHLHSAPVMIPGS